MNPTVSWLCVVLATGIAVFHCEGIRWLGLHRLEKFKNRNIIRNDTFCMRMVDEKIFTKKQRRFCLQQHKDKTHRLLEAAIDASMTTVAVCKERFQKFRWNCKVLEQVPKLAPELKTLTAEQALVHALSGFVLTYSFANECAKGITKRCSCGSNPTWLKEPAGEEAFQYKGCHSNIKMGEKLARKFLGLGRNRKNHGKNGRKKGKRSRANRRSNPVRHGGAAAYRVFSKLVNKHNYKVGIDVTKKSEAIVCTCHGSSSSCTMRFCRRVLHHVSYTRRSFNPYYRRYKEENDPLEILLDMYDKQKLRKAVLSEGKYQGYEEPCDPRQAADPFGDPQMRCRPGNYKIVPKMPPENVLLFHEHSLDYCVQRGQGGSFPGTHRRECVLDGSQEAIELMKNKSSKKGMEILCSVMCCGRGQRNETRKYRGNSKECPKTSCRLIQNPIKIICDDCIVHKSFCN